jgi:hypothetical protein
MVALGATLCLASPASAAFGLHGFDVTYNGPGQILDHADAPKGPLLTQAGAHPFEMTTSFAVNGTPTKEGGELVDEPLRNALFAQMPGFAGSATAIPACSTADFLTDAGGALGLSSCPDSTAVGVIAAQLASKKAKGFLYAAVYNLEPSPGKAARFGFWLSEVPVTIDAEVSEESPNLIVAGPTNTSQLVEVLGSHFTLWGVPADPRHDPLRGTCIELDGSSSGKDCHVGIEETPFLTMPRACAGPLTTTYKALSWLGSEDSGKALTHDESGNPQGMTGCGALTFAPNLSAVPTSHSAASPSGMDIDLRLPDEGLKNPTGIAGSDVSKAVVTFPEGVTLNPSQAEGLATCSEAQLAKEKAGSEFGEGCPAESKVGTVEVETPLLEGDVLKGSLFVATPYANRFDSLIAVYMTIKDPERGIGVTLAGEVQPDPRTGQLIATFGDEKSPIPQAPISDFRVHLREGARSPLITPSHCGDYATKMLLTPSGDPANPFLATSSFHIGSGVGGGPCPPAGPPPFDPGFEAGTTTNGAATHSPFTMRLTRRDGDQDLTKFSAALPRGVLASLVGVSKCSDAAIAAARSRTGPHGGAEELASPSCPANSKIGTSLAGAGVGSQLTYVPGSLYLAGPYNGAPLSVVSITPGVAGPFDVGTIVVRVALGFDPLTAQAKADGSRSDPIPHILRGIPLAVRDLRVNVDRPNWIFNPTSCAKSSTEASIFGSAADFFNPADDVPVGRSASFRAADCLALGFDPHLGLRLKGGTARGQYPAFSATYVPRAGDANLSGLSLLFPHSAFVENAHFRTICTRKAYAVHNCPKGSVYGHVKAYTPLLEEPLSGPVYLRSSNHLLPDAVLALHGIVDVEVPVKIDSFKQRLRATVKNAPDAPITKVVVQMQGGQKGLIVNSRNLCAGKNRAELNFTAQSTKTLQRTPIVDAVGCKGKARHRRHARR